MFLKSTYAYYGVFVLTNFVFMFANANFYDAKRIIIHNHYKNISAYYIEC